LIDHYEADVQTAQDYYPFGMIMPGRMYTALTVPGGSVTGTTQVTGFTVPVDLVLTSRSGNEPTQYVASRTIDLDEGFESGTNDDVTAYLTDTSYAGSGNGGSGADGVAGAGKYRYGFNGKEKNNETYGDGNEYDYGFRMRIGRFLSVDPISKRFPRYSPFQFAGNKPTVFIDLDGKEEADMKSDPGLYLSYLTKDIWDNSVDGLGNLLLRMATKDPEEEGLLIRKVLEKQGFNIPNSDYVSNEALAASFDIHKQSRTFVVTPEQTAAQKLLEIGFSALDVVAILPAEGSPFILGIKASPITTATISNIVKSLTIGARTKEIATSFLDLTRGGKGYVSAFEAESGAILEASHDLRLRQLKQGETGDYAIESGKIGGINASGKTVDQLGIPKTAIGHYKISSLIKQIGEHLDKKGVNFVLLDVRNITTEEKAQVTEYLKNT